MPKSMRTAAVVVLAVLAIAACSGSDKKPAPGTSGRPVSAASSSSSSSSASTSSGGASLSIITAEPAPDRFAFDTAGVEQVPAVPVEVTLANVATTAHEARMVKIRDGDFHAYQAAVVAQGSTASAGLADEVGAVGSTDPGRSTTSVVALTPGTYAIVCFLSAPDGKAFAQHGMIARVQASARS